MGSALQYSPSNRITHRLRLERKLASHSVKKANHSSWLSEGSVFVFGKVCWNYSHRQCLIAIQLTLCTPTDLQTCIKKRSLDDIPATVQQLRHPSQLGRENFFCDSTNTVQIKVLWLYSLCTPNNHQHHTHIHTPHPHS